jgi:hypothetical protein
MPPVGVGHRSTADMQHCQRLICIGERRRVEPRQRRALNDQRWLRHYPKRRSRMGGRAFRTP